MAVLVAGRTRIAYAEIVRSAPRNGDEYGSVYVSRLDGTERVRIAAHGTAPAWSPTGRTIAYLAACDVPPYKNTRLAGVRLVTPALGPFARPVASTECSAVGVAGPPTWSPDGTKIAMATRAGVCTMTADGKQLTRLSAKAPTSIAANRLSWSRPSWQPR